MSDYSKLLLRNLATQLISDPVILIFCVDNALVYYINAFCNDISKNEMNEELQLELENSQKESCSYMTEIYMLETESQDHLMTVCKQNKTLSDAF